MKQEHRRPTCFDWIHLFISFSIPVAIAVYTVVENNRDLDIARYNRVQDLQIADDKQKDLILHECQKTLARLIDKYGPVLNGSLSAPLVARFATLSALTRLDSSRRNFLAQVLYEAKLITYGSHDYRVPVSLQSGNLPDLNMVGNSDRKVLRNLCLEGAIMHRACFREVNIHGARFNDAALSDADFSWSHNGPAFDNELDISTIRFQQLVFRNANLTRASFFTATYEKVDFANAAMDKSNLRGFYCSNCLFDSTRMVEAHLELSKMVTSSFMFAMLIDANLYRSSFDEEIDFYQTDMSRVNGTHANFTRCIFNETKLINATLNGATFVDSTFVKAMMRNVSMDYSIIVNGNFTYADLSHSTWRYAFCKKCIFHHAILLNADLLGALFIESDFRNSVITENQLRQVTSLERSKLPVEVISNSI